MSSCFNWGGVLSMNIILQCPSGSEGFGPGWRSVVLLPFYELMLVVSAWVFVCDLHFVGSLSFTS